MRARVSETSTDRGVVLLGLDEDLEPCHGELGAGLWHFIGHRYEPVEAEPEPASEI